MLPAPCLEEARTQSFDEIRSTGIQAGGDHSRTSFPNGMRTVSRRSSAMVACDHILEIDP